MNPPPADYPLFLQKHHARECEWMTMVGIAVKILPVELSNNEPEDIVQKSVTTSHVRLYVTSVTANYFFATRSTPQQTTNEFEIP